MLGRSESQFLFLILYGYAQLHISFGVSIMSINPSGTQLQLQDEHAFMPITTEPIVFYPTMLNQWSLGCEVSRN